MLRKIISIATLFLKTTYSSRSTMMFTIAMPLIFTFVIGQAMKGMGSDAPSEQWPLLVVDEDFSDLSANFIARLSANDLLDIQMSDIESALLDVESNNALAVLVIPSGFESDALQAVPVELSFYQSAEAMTRAQMLLEAVHAASTELAGSLAATELSMRVADQVGLFNGASLDAQQTYSDEAFLAAESEWYGNSLIVIETEQVTRFEDRPTIPLGTTQTSPGMLVMYALFFTFGGGATLLVERDEGTLRRLLVMPLNKSTLITGKLLGIYSGALIQMAIMIVFGQYLFGVNWGQSLPALILLLLAYGFTSTALGLMVAALVKTAAQANAAGTISIMALASLGGAWWPIEITPDWMQQLSLAFPTGWAMRGFHDIITRGLDLSAIMLEVGVLISFGLLFLAVGIWRFRYE
jgi:ABC-2 type transport system permease protein